MTYKKQLSELNFLIDHCLKQGLSLACFKFPDSNTSHFITGILEKTNIENLKSGSFVISSFQNNGKIFFIKPTDHIQIDINLETEIEIPQHAYKSSTITTKDYKELIQSSLKDIQNQEFKKVVLARNQKIELPKGFNTFKYYLKLTKEYPKAFVSYISSPELGTWIGASPELLFKSDGENFETVSLAGTRTNDELNSKIGFSEKEIIEQELVSTYIREQLSDIPLEEKKSQIINAGNINHIQTKFISRLNGKPFFEIVKQLHPTPAICGYPKENALDFILKNEGFDRKLYGGFWGFYENENNIQLYVNLRTMELLHDHAVIYAGAGIVEGSVPEKEFIETENKMRTLLDLIEN